MSSVGRPTDVNTITMVTRPAWGIPAAPMLAAVAVILDKQGQQIVKLETLEHCIVGYISFANNLSMQTYVIE